MDEKDALRFSPNRYGQPWLDVGWLSSVAKSEWRRAMNRRYEAKGLLSSYTGQGHSEEATMQSKTAQWILWAITMTIFLALTLSGHFDWLGVAIVLSSLVWYTLVPRTTSR